MTKPPVPEANTVVSRLPQAGIVGSPVDQAVAHLGDDLAIDGPRGDDPNDTASVGSPGVRSVVPAALEQPCHARAAWQPCEHANGERESDHSSPLDRTAGGESLKHLVEHAACRP